MTDSFPGRGLCAHAHGRDDRHGMRLARVKWALAQGSNAHLLKPIGSTGRL